MRDQAGKKAIILRGPPATGKSNVAKTLLEGLQCHKLSTSSEPIVLDHSYESPCQGEERYKDIAAKQDEPVVVIEICCGELIFSIGDTFWLLDARPGPTRNPAEWIAMLKRQERDVFCFLLWASWPVARARNAGREKRLRPDFAKMLYDFYSLEDWRRFPDKVGITENRLDMEELDVQSAADSVWQVCGFP